MSSLAMEVETGSENKHKQLASWVEEVAHMCKPDRVYWCDGSGEEYQAMLRLMVLAGIAIPLPPGKPAHSNLARSDPCDGGRGEDRTLICSATQGDPGPAH